MMPGENWVSVTIPLELFQRIDNLNPKGVKPFWKKIQSLWDAVRPVILTPDPSKSTAPTSNQSMTQYGPYNQNSP